MPATLAGIHLGPDTHANRPAANASGLPIGSLYLCSDHSLIYKTDGSSWSTWATLGGGSHAASHESGGADEIDVTGLTGAGGGGVGWNQDVNESGASFANFTGVSGTWASNGSEIQQTNAGTGAYRTARYNTILPLGLPWIFETEIRVDSTPGATPLAGVIIAYDGTANGGGIGVSLEADANVVKIDQAQIAARGTLAHTINETTWYKLRVVSTGWWFSIYVDGTLKGTIEAGAGASGDPQSYIGLITFNATVSYRNLKFWTLSTGLPA